MKLTDLTDCLTAQLQRMFEDIALVEVVGRLDEDMARMKAREFRYCARCAQHHHQSDGGYRDLVLTLGIDVRPTHNALELLTEQALEQADQFEMTQDYYDHERDTAAAL